jgi:hypothetical protein
MQYGARAYLYVIDRQKATPLVELCMTNFIETSSKRREGGRGGGRDKQAKEENKEQQE